MMPGKSCGRSVRKLVILYLQEGSKKRLIVLLDSLSPLIQSGAPTCGVMPLKLEWVTPPQVNLFRNTYIDRLGGVSLVIYPVEMAMEINYHNFILDTSA